MREFILGGATLIFLIFKLKTASTDDVKMRQLKIAHVALRSDDGVSSHKCQKKSLTSRCVEQKRAKKSKSSVPVPIRDVWEVSLIRCVSLLGNLSKLHDLSLFEVVGGRNYNRGLTLNLALQVRTPPPPPPPPYSVVVKVRLQLEINLSLPTLTARDGRYQQWTGVGGGVIEYGIIGQTNVFGGLRYNGLQF